MVYFNAFIVCFNVFHYISMCLNVDIVIKILPSHSHCKVFTMHTYLYIFISLYTMTSFPTCYTTTLFFFHSHWFVPTFIQSMKKLHINPYFTFLHHSTFYVPHSMSSLGVRSIAKPTLIYKCNILKLILKKPIGSRSYSLLYTMISFFS
jgi:hypothetical protein